MRLTSKTNNIKIAPEKSLEHGVYYFVAKNSVTIWQKSPYFPGFVHPKHPNFYMSNVIKETFDIYLSQLAKIALKLSIMVGENL